MDRPPYFAFYPADFANDINVEAMSPLQVGAYMLLLCKAWQADPPASLPNDDQILARLARVDPAVWAEIKAGVLVAFRVHADGRLHSKRLRKEYDAALSRIKDRSQLGKKGAAARWAGRSDAVGNAGGMPPALPGQCRNDAIQNQNQKKKEEEEELPPEIDPTDKPPRPDDVIAVWNAVPGLPAFKGTNPHFRRLIAERWRDHRFRERWADVFAALGKSDWHTGRAGKGDDVFVATLTWCLGEQGFEKAYAVLERQDAKPAPPPVRSGRNPMLDYVGDLSDGMTAQSIRDRMAAHRGASSHGF